MPHHPLVSLATILLLVTSLSACKKKGEDTGGPSPSDDTDEPDDDTGEPDETGDTGDTGETGDTGPTGPCGEGDPIFTATVIGPAGPCETCPAGQGLTLAASVYNPSTEPIELTFTTGCVVSDWRVTDEDSLVWGESPACSEAEVTRTIAGCDSLLDAWSEPVTLPAGTYTLLAEFSLAGNPTGRRRFVVE